MWSENVNVRFARMTAAAETFPLSTAERNELDRFRDRNRRRGWICGRQIARHCLVELFCGAASDPSLADFEILSRNEQGTSVRPIVRIRNKRIACSLSISHSDCGAIVAITPDCQVAVGIDLVPLATFQPKWQAFWLTDVEQRDFPSADLREAATCWAVKEAFYKAVNRGESFQPRQIEVRRSSAGELRVSHRGRDSGGRCRVHSWEVDGHVAALVEFTASRTLEGHAACFLTESPPADIAIAGWRNHVTVGDR